MSRTEILEKLQIIFRDSFDDESLTITEETTANDVEGWDSLMHIALIAEVEDVFDFKFEMKDVVGMKNVGDMVSIIEDEA